MENMKTFDYTVKDELGIHARPAGLLVKEAKNFTSKITIKKGEKEVDATRVMAVMALGVKQGETVTVNVDGADEDAAVAAMKAFFAFIKIPSNHVGNFRNTFVFIVESGV